jgi:multimeric flavodoxin WrbA
MRNVKITAIVGSYRKGGIIDQAVEAILDSAKESGAETEIIRLIDKHIEFCTNCRACTQDEGPGHGQCPIADDMNDILEKIDRSDALIFASPMNFWTVTAVMKKFIERLVCFAYWPWGSHAPKVRKQLKIKPALVVCSSAAPGFLARILTKMVKLLKIASNIVGAKVIGVLFIGLAAGEKESSIGKRAERKARKLGEKLVSASRKVMR